MVLPGIQAGQQVRDLSSLLATQHPSRELPSEVNQNMTLQILTASGSHQIGLSSFAPSEIQKLLEKLLGLEDAEGELLCAVRTQTEAEPRFLPIDLVLKGHCRSVLIIGAALKGVCKASLRTRRYLERRGEALNLEI
jgi:hypothetical protein